MEPEAEQDIVHVSRKTPALASPAFVIEQDGKYYISLAVLEYDAAAAKTPEQERGVEQVRMMFEASQKDCGLRAGCLERSLRGRDPMNTSPHGD